MITDEMVEVARAAYHDARSSGIPRQGPESLMRAALEAVAPAIRAAALEEAASAVEQKAKTMHRQECCGCGVGSPPECCGDPILMVSDSEAVAAIRALKELTP
jgi:hypothetical protein